MSRTSDLRAVGAAAALSAALALAVPVEWLSLILLAPLAFFITGYAILAATLVASPPPWPQTLALSVGLSLAMLALGSLPLNYLGGIAAGSWAVLLVAVVAIACAVALRRRPPDWSDPRPRPSLPRPSRSQGALALLGLAASAAAVVLAFVPLGARHAVGFSELWLRPAAGGVAVGVGSEEKAEASYRLLVRIAGRRAPVVRVLHLQPGETSSTEIPASSIAPGRPVFVSASLFLAGSPDTPYRSVYGWVPPS